MTLSYGRFGSTWFSLSIELWFFNFNLSIYFSSSSLNHTRSAVGLSLLFSRSLFELHLTEMQHGCRAAVQAHLFRVLEAEYSERFLPQQQQQFTASASTATDPSHTHALLALQKLVSLIMKLLISPSQTTIFYNARFMSSLPLGRMTFLSSCIRHNFRSCTF